MNDIFTYNLSSKDKNLHVSGVRKKWAGERKVIWLKKVVQVP